MNDKKITHFPVLSNYDFIFVRFLGPGLGNLLFPLYRAFQGQKKFGGVLVFPQFFQIKLGTFIRNEKDKRTYIDLFINRTFKEVSLHIYTAWISRIPFHKITNKLNSEGREERGVIRYEDVCECFKSLNDQYRHDFYLFLLSRAKQKSTLEKEIENIHQDDIAVHIRRGDFSPVSARNETGKASILIEDNWYVEAVKVARRISPKGKIRVFTDDHNINNDLLKKLHCYEVDISKNALHSILKMSKHGYLIASRSTFSLWSAYLGQQHIIIHKNFDIEKYMLTKNMKMIKLDL